MNRRSPDLLRSLAVGFGVGATVALVAVLLGFSIIAMPLFFLARVLEPGGRIDHPFLREGLVQWALPVGLALGAACGAVAGVWYARGGRLHLGDGRRSFHETS